MSVRSRMESLLTEGVTPVAPMMIRNSIHMLDERLKPRLKKWGADQAIVTGSAKGIEVKVWLEGPEEEARDSAKIILGSGFSLTPHKLKKNYFVATALYQMADIFF